MFSLSKPPSSMLSPKKIGKSRDGNPKGMHYGNVFLTATLQVTGNYC